MGPARRQAALSRIQLAGDHAAGNDPHAAMTRLVLGSASSGRLRVLRQAGVDPLVMVSSVDEEAVSAGLSPDAAPHDVVCALAKAKAEDVAAVVDPAVAADCVVVGCDSMLYLDGRLIGKPGSIDDARQQW